MYFQKEDRLSRHFELPPHSIPRVCAQVAELKKIAKESGMTGYSKLKKDQLVNAIVEATSSDEE